MLRDFALSGRPTIDTIQTSNFASLYIVANLRLAGYLDNDVLQTCCS